jgi:hypothetical protein
MSFAWDFVDECEYHELLEVKLTKCLLVRALCLWLRFEKIDLAHEFKCSINFAPFIRQFPCGREKVIEKG